MKRIFVQMANGATVNFFEGGDGKFTSWVEPKISALLVVSRWEIEAWIDENSYRIVTVYERIKSKQ